MAWAALSRRKYAFAKGGGSPGILRDWGTSFLASELVAHDGEILMLAAAQLGPHAICSHPTDPQTGVCVGQELGPKRPLSQPQQLTGWYNMSRRSEPRPLAVERLTRLLMPHLVCYQAAFSVAHKPLGFLAIIVGIIQMGYDLVSSAHATSSPESFQQGMVWDRKTISGHWNLSPSPNVALA